MSNMGVFQWIREGVRKSVLLGFSDAVEQLGVPTEEGQINSQMLAVLRQAPVATLEHRPAAVLERSSSKTERKRLGRSLDQIRDTPLRASGESRG